MSEDIFKVDIAKLITITGKLLEHLREVEGDSIGVDEDYYWHIQPEEIYNVQSHPQHLTMGQLTSDWEDLIDFLDEENDPICYGLVWLSAILSYIGEKVVR